MPGLLTKRDAPAPATTNAQRQALGVLHGALIAEQRTRRDVDDARRDNDSALRKNRAVPWGPYFRALDALESAARGVLDAFNVK